MECCFVLEQGTGIEQLLLYDLPNVFYYIVRIRVQNNSWNMDETREENAPASEKVMTVLFSCLISIPQLRVSALICKTSLIKEDTGTQFDLLPCLIDFLYVFFGYPLKFYI